MVKSEDVGQTELAQQLGEQLTESIVQHGEALHANSGSTEDVSDTNRSLDDAAAPSIGSPSLGAAGVSPQPGSSPNVTTPTDNTQSQP
jgi:hypothetical protein